MYIIVKRLKRSLVRGVSLFLPRNQAIALDRWRRGQEEYRKYRLSDYVVASYGKSGRTWMRVMLSRYYQLTYDLPERILMGFDNFHKINSAVPRIFFTHDNYLRTYTGNVDSKKDFYDKKVILLVRRPQDVAVSQFFQWKYRMRPHKMAMNRYPPAGSDISMYDFVMNPDCGVPRIIDFLNLWASEMPKIRNLLLVRYEDMRARPEQELARVVKFLGMEPDAAKLKDTVEFSSVENLRKLEKENYFWRSGSRIKAKDPHNPNSYKVRRAKVGGYRDYFDDEQVARIDALVDERLSDVFGYSGEASSSAVPPAAEQVSGI
ncbi:MAG TPA: sulfotransferase [Gammaproteobacteria bacterium]|nr:sulfotransferase [Gammaproteobacteria bacterium]